MAKINVGLPQGTRDFSAEVVRKRAYILDTIKNVFERYGYQPLETPAMENLETLMGKYGEEGDKLIFKVLNNGLNDPKNTEKAKAGFDSVLSGKSSKDITERALKYDLTIPFARYVAMNHQQLVLPFKRYQVQPVWRADRPQKGRYREFYQCDADVVGSNSLLNEVELATIYATVFEQLGIPVEIKINSRKILSGLAAMTDAVMTDITVAIDKLDKIGLDKVKFELAEKGLSPSQIYIIQQYLGIEGDNLQKLDALHALFKSDETAKAGLSELQYLVDTVSPKHRDAIVIDPNLARGLNYYTGVIFEVKARTVQMGSIGGGGRYDDLTGLFGVSGIPGVGISFGVDRIYDVMEELKLFPANVFIGTQVLFFNMGLKESEAAFKVAETLRNKGVRAELYPETVKFDKQFKYAEKKGIPFVVIIGEKELAESTCNLKDLRSGVQKSLKVSELYEFSF